MGMGPTCQVGVGCSRRRNERRSGRPGGAQSATTLTVLGAGTLTGADKTLRLVCDTTGVLNVLDSATLSVFFSSN